MNYSAIDLDINNYDDEDLEAFFSLGKRYSEIDIAKKETLMREKIMGTVLDRGFQNKLFIFLDEAKRILFQKIKQTSTILNGVVIDQTPQTIPNTIQPMNTFPTETAPGILNRLRRRTRIMSLAMNTLFRDCNSYSSSDCFFTLSYTLKNVVSLRLLSIELPESIYLISNKNSSNWLYIYVPANDISGNVIIPDGCYDYLSLQTTLENAINAQLGVNYFKVLIDTISKKTSIYTTNNFEFDIIFYYDGEFMQPSSNSQTGIDCDDCIDEEPYTTICCDNNNKKYKRYNVTCRNSDKFEKSLGWILGYREKIYYNSKKRFSEGLFFQTPIDYLFFVLNDYHIYNSSNLIAMFKDSYIDKNMLAKIPYSNTNFQVLFDGSDEILSPKRQYFGPVDIKKMGVQLLNKYGDIVDLNFMDFSFTLEAEMIYDI